MHTSKAFRFNGLSMVLIPLMVVFVLSSCNNTKKADTDNKTTTEKTAVQADSQEKTASMDKEASKTGPVVVTGEVLDLSCFLGHGAKGQGHMSCAQNCLAKGLPAGILAEDGQVYLLLENHSKAEAYAKAIEHAAENITVTGKAVSNNGVQGIVIEKVEVVKS